MVSPAEIMRDMYDAWRRGDLEAATAPMASSIVYTFHVPTSIHPLGGACHGKDATIERLGQLVDEFEMVSFETGPILADDRRAATQITIGYVNRKTGEPLDVSFAHFVEFDGDRIVRFDEYHDLAVVEDYSRRAGLI